MGSWNPPPDLPTSAAHVDLFGHYIGCFMLTRSGAVRGMERRIVEGGKDEREGETGGTEESRMEEETIRDAHKTQCRERQVSLHFSQPVIAYYLGMSQVH
ncbi:hypothetical protein E2C01_065406 [Portunus trituberculatus]|uniref:Uncharacterized protein n=1 Tax=Portunus trituberculatus TaxID=210409 RepID=A0A5B7HMH5_PORTR|nr:hypothetical protein [Portunus trituberculatus]